MPNSRCIETGAREGVYLGSQLPVDALPGRPGQNRAEPGMTLDRADSLGFSAGNGAFFICFFTFFSKLVILC